MFTHSTWGVCNFSVHPSGDFGFVSLLHHPDAVGSNQVTWKRIVVDLLIHCLYRGLIVGEVTVLSKSSWELWKNVVLVWSTWDGDFFFQASRLTLSTHCSVGKPASPFYISVLIPQFFCVEHCRGMKVNGRIKSSTRKVNVYLNAASGLF